MTAGRLGQQGKTLLFDDLCDVLTLHSRSLRERNYSGLSPISKLSLAQRVQLFELTLRQSRLHVPGCPLVYLNPGSALALLLPAAHREPGCERLPEAIPASGSEL